MLFSYFLFSRLPVGPPPRYRLEEREKAFEPAADQSCIVNNEDDAVDDKIDEDHALDDVPDDTIDARPVLTVSVGNVGFAQRSANDVFKDGRPLSETVQALNERRIDPMTAPFMRLLGVKVRNRLLALNNRRLWCLKEHLRFMQGEEVQMKLQMLIGGIFIWC